MMPREVSTAARPLSVDTFLTEPDFREPVLAPLGNLAISHKKNKQKKSGFPIKSLTQKPPLLLS